MVVRGNTLAEEQTFTEHRSVLSWLNARPFPRVLPWLLSLSRFFYTISEAPLPLHFPELFQLFYHYWGVGDRGKQCRFLFWMHQADWFPCRNATFIFCGNYQSQWAAWFIRTQSNLYANGSFFSLSSLHSAIRTSEWSRSKKVVCCQFFKNIKTTESCYFRYQSAPTTYIYFPPKYQIL